MRSGKTHCKQSRELIDKESAREAMKSPELLKRSRDILLMFSDEVQTMREILRIIFPS